MVAFSELPPHIRVESEIFAAVVKSFRYEGDTPQVCEETCCDCEETCCDCEETCCDCEEKDKKVVDFSENGHTSTPA